MDVSPTFLSNISPACYPDCLMGGGKLTGHLRSVHVLAGFQLFAPSEFRL